MIQLRLSIALLFMTGIAFAQESDVRQDTVYRMSPVVVTATTATHRLSPIPFSDLTRTQIQRTYSTQDIPVLLSDLPSMTSYSENGSGIGYNYINLRGFDQRRISVMINGVPQNDPEDHNVYWIDFPDLLASTQVVQVQRGAGSAFYGPPAIGGSVNLIANPFASNPGVTFESAFGFQELAGKGRTDLATRKLALSVNSGLVDGTYMFYGRLGRLSTNGYRELAWVNMHSYFLGAARFDGDMVTRIHLFGGPITDGLAYKGLPKSYNNDVNLRRTNFSDWKYDSTGVSFEYAVPQKSQSREWFSQPHYEIIHDWKLSERLALHTTAFFVQGDGYFDYDGDWLSYTPPAVDWFQRHVGYDSTFGVTSYPTMLIRGSVENRQWGILPRVEIDHGDGTMTLGLELRMHRSLHYGQILFASQYPSSAYAPDTRIYEYRGLRDIASAYVHEVYRMDEGVAVTADVQLVYNRYGMRDERFLGHTWSVPYWFVNPRVGANVNLTEHLHVYGFIGYTSREPRMRNHYAAEDAFFGATPEFAADTTGGVVRYDFSRPLAKPERLLDIEMGGGWTSANAHLTANLFWMDFTDELVKSGQVDIFGQPVTGNADKTRHIGLEVDGSVKLNDRWSLSGNFTYSRNRLVRYRVIVDDSTVALDENPIAGFPDVLMNLRASYDDGTIGAAATAKYVGPFYTDNFKNVDNRNDEYRIVNLEGTWRIPFAGFADMTLRCEVRNALNKLYTLSGEGEAFFPSAERNYVLGMMLRF